MSYFGPKDSTEYEAAMADHNYEKALYLSDELLKKDKYELKNYLRKIHTLKAISNYEAAMEVINLGLENLPNDSMLFHMQKVIEKDLARIRVYERVYELRKETFSELNSKCDVLCMASNEAPYIAEFIHHYLKLGASSIYIGVNDSSQDEMLEIIKDIANVYSQIKIVDTNGIDLGLENYSNASFAKIWEVAALESTSSFALIVDVDEFLHFKNLGCQLSDIVKSNNFASCISFPYLDQKGSSSSFSKPFLADSPIIVKSDWTKSLVSYDCRIREIKPHVPVFSVENDMLNCISSGGGKRIPISVYGRSVVFADFISGAQAGNFSYNNCAWIYHLSSRSELEYAFRCIDHWPGNQTQFYANRKGYCIESHDDNFSSYIERIKTSSELKEYQLSLGSFIEECGITSKIEKAKCRYTESRLLTLLEEFEDDTIIKERNIWKRSFSGTKYLVKLNERLDKIYQN